MPRKKLSTELKIAKTQGTAKNPGPKKILIRKTKHTITFGDGYAKRTKTQRAARKAKRSRM